MQLVEGDIEVVDVMQRERGKGRIERLFVSERLERRPPEDRADRCVRIDGDEVITVRRERPRELSAAAATSSTRAGGGGSSRSATAWRSTPRS